ncbi:MAG: hypothetical protein PHT94_03465 [Candidatus Nanoarchaeia archaeon]|nr:hypothetical protein [Candidatus Nanoarchaeia archaeon]
MNKKNIINTKNKSVTKSVTKNKKGVFSPIIGAVLMLLTIGLSSYLILSNLTDVFDFNEKMNETINYSQSENLKIPAFDLEERKDALKIYIATQYLSNIEYSEEISKIFKSYKQNCADGYENCFKIDDTIISCNNEKCYVENFYLEDELETFIEEYNQIDLRNENYNDCLPYAYQRNSNEFQKCTQKNQLIYSCKEAIEKEEKNEITTIELNKMCLYNDDAAKKDDIIKKYKEINPLPTRYITFGNLPELEIKNLQSSFLKEGIVTKKIINIAYMALNFVQVIDTTSDFLKFISKTNSELTMKLTKKLSSIAFVDANKGNTVTVFLKNFVPDILKYNSAIPGEKISYLFLDDDLIKYYKETKKIVNSVDTPEDFIYELRKMNRDITDETKLKNLYNNIKTNNVEPDILKNVELQYAFELSASTKKKSFAKTLFSNVMALAISKNTDKKTISLLNMMREAFANFNEYSSIRKIMQEGTDSTDNIMKKIVANSNDFTENEMEVLRNIFSEMAPDLFGKNVENVDDLIKTTIKNSDTMKNVLTQNYNILKGGSALTSTDIQFKNLEFEKLFAETSEFLSEFINDGKFSEDIVQLILEHNFAKLSKNNIKNDAIQDIFLNKIKKINTKNFQSQSQVIRVINNDNVVRFSNTDTIIVEAAGEFYETTGDVFDKIRRTDGLAHSSTGQFVKTEYYDPIRFKNALINNEATIKSASETLDTSKIVKIQPTSNINLVATIDPAKKMDFIKKYGSDFPLINNDNIDDVFDTLNDYLDGKISLEDILEQDALSVIQDADLFENIAKNIVVSDATKKRILESTELLSNYDNVIKELSMKNIDDVEYLFKKTIFNSMDTTRMTKFVDAFVSDNNFYDTVLSNLPHGFFKKIFDKTNSFIFGDATTRDAIKIIGGSAFELYAFNSCKDLIIDAFSEEIYDLNPLDIVSNSEINKNIDSYKNNLKNDNDNIFTNFIKEKTGINNLNEVNNILFADYCVAYASTNLKKSIGRIFFNYFEEQNALYLPNQMNSIDTISLYNKDNYYSFDQLEYFSPLELTNFNNSLLRLKKSNDVFESFYLVSPCKTDLIFKRNDSVQCKYEAFDFIYNGYTLEGDTSSLTEICEKKDFEYKSNEEKKIEIESNLLTNDDIKNKYTNLMKQIVLINEVDSSIISNFLYMLFDRNMEYSSFYFLNSKNNLLPDEMYYNIVLDSLYNNVNNNNNNNNFKFLNEDNSFNIIHNLNNYVYDDNDDFNYNVIIQIQNINFSYFLKNDYYSKYNLPTFYFNFSNSATAKIQTDIREYNNLKYFYNNENKKYIPIILNISKNEFKEDLANIDFSDINKYLLNEKDFNDFLNNYKKDIDLNIYQDYYVYDIIYNEDNNFNHTYYTSYFETFNIVEILRNNQVNIQNSNNKNKYYNFIFGNNKNYDQNINDNSGNLPNYYKYPTLLETIFILDNFEEQIIDFTKISENNKKFNLENLKNVFNIVAKYDLFDFAFDYFDENKLVYYNCSHLNYDELKKYNIIKRCNIGSDISNNINEKTNSIDVSLLNVDENSYCYSNVDGIYKLYQDNNKKMSWIMAIPGIVGGFLGPSPLGLILNTIDVAYSFYDYTMNNLVEKLNKWPKSGIPKN